MQQNTALPLCFALRLTDGTTVPVQRKFTIFHSASSQMTGASEMYQTNEARSMPECCTKENVPQYNITVGKYDNNRGMDLATRSHWNRAGSFTQHSVRTQRKGAVTRCTQIPQYVSMRAALWRHFADKAVPHKISNTDNVEAQMSRSPCTSNYHLQGTKLKRERRLTRWLTVIGFR